MIAIVGEREQSVHPTWFGADRSGRLLSRLPLLAVVTTLALRAVWGVLVWTEPPHVAGADVAAIVWLIRAVTVASVIVAVLLVPFILYPRLLPWIQAALLMGGAVAGVFGWRLSEGAGLGFVSLVTIVVCAVGAVLVPLLAPSGSTR